MANWNLLSCSLCPLGLVLKGHGEQMCPFLHLGALQIIEACYLIPVQLSIPQAKPTC